MAPATAVDRRLTAHVRRAGRGVTGCTYLAQIFIADDDRGPVRVRDRASVAPIRYLLLAVGSAGIEPRVASSVIGFVRLIVPTRCTTCWAISSGCGASVAGRQPGGVPLDGDLDRASLRQDRVGRR